MSSEIHRGTPRYLINCKMPKRENKMDFYVIFIGFESYILLNFYYVLKKISKQTVYTIKSPSVIIIIIEFYLKDEKIATQKNAQKKFF